jgi:hypothetical protein
MLHGIPPFDLFRAGWTEDAARNDKSEYSIALDLEIRRDVLYYYLVHSAGMLE